ncbi:MAG: glycosyltransferase family 4 protein [Alphaproteobacteria bacterium]
MSPDPKAPPDKLRVLIWYWGRKGAGPLYTFELLRAFAAHPGLEVTATLAYDNEMLAETHALGLPEYIVKTYQSLPQFALATLRLPWLRREFGNFLKRGRFDIVMSPMSHLWTPFMADLAAKNGAAYIAALHDAEPHPGENQPLWSWRRKREIAQTDHIIALSESVAAKLAASGIARQSISVIPFGVPAMEDIPPLPRQFPHGRKFLFMFFGRIMAYKGLDRLLAAYAILRSRRDDIELAIVGAGDLSPYKKQIGALPDMTVVNRWIGEEEIPSFLNQADALALPYIEASQSGVTSIAYAAGLPVAATPVGGLAEQVIDGETGALARDASPQAIAEAMAKLCRPAFYERCAQGAMEYRQTWSFAAQAGLYANLFAEVKAKQRVIAS